ncbi:MAG: toxic anion resistance protein [Clostridia bacterium]|nr:toxic anion resistance protein [Clostridia bacterium]
MNETLQPCVPPLDDVNGVLNYGADAQSRVAEFSQIVLGDLSETHPENISEKIADLIVKLKETEEEEKSANFRLFRKSYRASECIKVRYRKACEAVDKISLSLIGHRNILLKDIERMDLLYAMNREQYEVLSRHLEKGKEALEQFRIQRVLPLQEKSEKTDDPGDVQEARDAMEQHDRFAKKLHDLELTRAVSLQMAPQIRILQNNNTILAEKIQTSMVNTIPLWKSQMMLTLGMEHARSAMELQQKVSQITDSLLKQNARTLKETTLAVTKEGERSLIDIETLKETNNVLIETFDEMLKLRQEGQKARKSAEEELKRLHREIRLRLTEKNTPQLSLK